MKQRNLSILLGGWIGGIVFLFFIAGIVASFFTSFSSTTFRTWSKDIQAEDILIYLFQTENHYLYEGEPFWWDSISNTVIKLAINMQPTDTRTYLGKELPGFAIFDTEIIIAGSGTDFTTMPVESPPPMDVLLKERELAKEQLEEKTEKEQAPPVIGEQSVLIYHSHSWESFLPLLDGVKNRNEAVSSNENVNVIAVGKKLQEELRRYGIGAEHDRTNMTDALHSRNLTYRDSYKVSREVVKEAMATNDGITYLIDIHRDAQPRKITTATINGKNYAKIYFIVGKDHKQYEKNLKVATALHNKIEEKYPGLSRGVFAKSRSGGNGIYNQDLSERALLVEFGGVENNMEELENTVEAFAEIFSEYYFDAEMVNG